VLSTSGADVAEGVSSLHAWGGIARALAQASGIVPIILVVTGPAVCRGIRGGAVTQSAPARSGRERRKGENGTTDRERSTTNAIVHSPPFRAHAICLSHAMLGAQETSTSRSRKSSGTSTVPQV